jgi:deoxyribonuclease V
MSVAEVSIVTDAITFPYVPGLLTFREAPLVLKACKQLAVGPDLFLVDGQGYAHPRRIGLASHLGLCLQTPTIGCAKSRLIGEYDVPGDAAGCASDLVDMMKSSAK